MYRLVFLVIALLANSGNGLFSDPISCSGSGLISQGLCRLGSEAAGFVFCNTTINKCQCRPEFDGNASPANKCRCSAPKQVYFQLSTSEPLNNNVLSDSFSSIVPADWGVERVRCVDFLGLEAAEAKNEKHKASVFKFFNNTIFPTPQIILANPAFLYDILSPTVKSRISPAGSFNGFAGVTEYFYGFVAQPGNLVKSFDIRSIAATGNTVAAKANILINNTNQQTMGFPPPLFNLSIFAFFTFDNNDKIASIDVSVPNLGKLLDSGIPQLEAQRRAFTCQIVTNISLLSPNPSGTCASYPPFPGSTPQERFGACFAFMNSIPHGSYNRINSNTVVCRFLHALLTVSAPQEHCPHVSQSGGGACIDFTYESFFQEEY